MAVNIASKIYTVSEYFELEKNSTVRHEFHYGKLIEMPGESIRANDIALNIVELMRKPFKKKGYKVHAHDIKVQVNLQNIYRYPDIVVAPETDYTDGYKFTQPEILMEIASENSFSVDSGTKMKEYLKIPTLKYYLIISQDEMSVIFYARKGSNWIIETYENIHDAISLDLFDTSLSLGDIYEEISFADNMSD